MAIDILMNEKWAGVRSTLRDKLFWVLFLVICQVGFLKLVKDSESVWIDLPPQADQKLNPEIFKILTVGQLPVAVDWLFMNCLQDTAIATKKTNERPSVFYDLDLATDLDPAFYQAYFMGSNYLIVAKKDPIGAEILLNKGSGFIQNKLMEYPESFRKRFWPWPWQLYIPMGYLYLFELNDLNKAGDAFKKASAFPTAPNHLYRISEKLKTMSGVYEIGFRVLKFMIDHAADEKIKALLEQKRLYFFISQYLVELNDEFQKFLKTHLRFEPAGHYSLVQYQEFFRDFLHKKQMNRDDPWGGTISVNDKGVIITTTFYEPVFGL